MSLVFVHEAPSISCSKSPTRVNRQSLTRLICREWEGQPLLYSIGFESLIVESIKKWKKVKKWNLPEYEELVFMLNWTITITTNFALIVPLDIINFAIDTGHQCFWHCMIRWPNCQNMISSDWLKRGSWSDRLRHCCICCCSRRWRCSGCLTSINAKIKAKTNTSSKCNICPHNNCNFRPFRHWT